MSHHRRFPALAAAVLPLCLMFLVPPPQTAGTVHAQTLTPGTAADTISTSEVPFYSEWVSSPHALRSAEEFNHWNAAGSIPVACAR